MLFRLAIRSFTLWLWVFFYFESNSVPFFNLYSQILPLSLARYLSFAHHYVPFAVTVFVDMIYLASGLFNVLLFSFTRPFLLPHDPRIPNMAPKPKPPHILHREDQGNGVDTMPPATPREFAIEYQRPPVHSTDEDTLLSSEAGSCETRVNNSSEKPLGW
jgi:hypothetical protein